MPSSPKKLSILAVSRTTAFHELGGFSDHVQELYEGLAASGHRVDLVTTAAPDPETPEMVEKNGVRFFFVKGTIPAKYSKAWSQGSLKKVTELLQTETYDVFHSQSNGAAGILKSGILSNYKLPSYISYHGTGYDEFCSKDNILKYTMRFKGLERIDNYIRYRFERRRDKAIQAATDYIIATSDQQRDILSTIYNVPDEKLRVVYNGMSVDDFSPGDAPENLIQKYDLAGKKVILSLARFVRGKAIPYAVQAFSLLRKKRSDVKLLIVGFGPQEKKIRSEIDRLNLHDDVILAGAVPFKELPDYFRLADSFINPVIRQNGYDLTMVEAMASECPVVATDIGSHPTLVKNGKNGILIPIADIDGFGEGLSWVLDNPKAAKAIGKAARETIIKDFTTTKMVKTMAKTYQEGIETYAMAH